MVSGGLKSIGKSKNNGDRLVASSLRQAQGKLFGLRSGLRQSGGRFAAALRRGVEAPLCLRSKGNDNRNAERGGGFFRAL
jgi:hypothetical protein